MSSSQSDTAYQHYLWGELFTPFAGDNQSLYAVLTRFAWPSESAFTGHSNAMIRTLSPSIGIALLALLFIKPRRKDSAPEAQSPLKLLAEFSLFPMLMLFSSPVTQIHHYTVTYGLFLAALMMIKRYPAGSWPRKCLGIGVWTCALCLTLGMIFEWAGVWGLPLWGSMLLWTAVLCALKLKHS